MPEYAVVSGAVALFVQVGAGLAVLLCFVEAHSDILGPLLRLFCKDPGMNQSDYKVIYDQVFEWLQRQFSLPYMYPLRWLNSSYRHYMYMTHSLPMDWARTGHP